MPAPRSPQGPRLTAHTDRPARRVLGSFSALGALAVGLAASVTACGSSATQSAPKITLSPCTVQARLVECGRLTVPQDRLTGTGRRISLRVVVLPATARNPQPDPVVYLAGGPGYGASDFVGDMAVVLAALNRERAVIFVDQRGMGGSNELACPSPDPGVDVGVPTQLGSYLRTCLPRLSGDPRFYTTAMAADDVADVLHALGYNRANLYGGSYGATLAQVFMRRHPGMVRTATLRGGSLLDTPLIELSPRNSQAALDDLFTRCHADTACRAAYPDPAAELATLMSQLKANPVVLPADRSPTHQTITLDPASLGGAVNELLKSTEAAVQLPMIIHAFATSDDRASLLATYATQMPSLTQPPGKLLVASYIIKCDEPWAKFSTEAIERDAPDSYYLPAALENASYYQEVCPRFPQAGPAADYGPPIHSPVPVLILNGSADPQDPPANMAGAKVLWANSLQLIEPGQAHGGSQWQCSESIIDAFIAQASITGLDTRCLAGVQLPPFPTTQQ